MRTIVITGANTGIGRATAEGLAAAGDHFILAGRSLERTQETIDTLRAKGARVDFVAVDLASLASVRSAAASIRSMAPRIDLLVNNAGLAGLKGLTTDGFELAFGVNHLSHFLLTTALLDILRTSSARIINVASDGHRMAKYPLDFDALEKSTKTSTGFFEYGVSKACNILFTRELVTRFGSEIQSYALHPGVIASEIWREIPAPLRVVMKLFMRNTSDGARTSIHCATADIPKDDNGRYFENAKRKRPTKLVEDDALARELWERSERWIAGARA